MILFWDSSDMTTHLELQHENNSWHYDWEANRTLARDMLAYLRDRLGEHDATLRDVTGIGVFRGPGSYTGLRIGLTVLNTIAESQQIPIVGETGEDWRQMAEKRLARGDNDTIVLPEYGAEARVTQPRK